MPHSRLMQNWFLLVLSVLGCQTLPAPRAAAQAPGPLALNRENFTAGGRPAFLMLPSPEKRSTPQPWIFYAPSLPAYPDETERWMHERFLEAGIAIAGVDVGEAYGSPKQSHAPFAALYDELVDRRAFAPKPCLFGRSRGGLWVTSWALAHPEKVAGITGIYPVFDLRSYPKLEAAAPAYGLTTEELQRQLDKFNPVARLDQLAKAKIPVALISGDQDAVVPLQDNSAALVRAYEKADVKDQVTLIVLPGQGHNFHEGFFKSQALVDFTIARARAGVANSGPDTK